MPRKLDKPPEYINYNPTDEIREKMYNIRNREGISYSFQVQEGLKLYFQSKEEGSV